MSPVTINLDLSDFIPRRMRFTKGVSNSTCFRKDHEWKETEVGVGVPFRGSFPVFECQRCKERGFLMDEIYWMAEGVYEPRV